MTNKSCVWINHQLHQWLIINCNHWPVSCSQPWDSGKNKLKLWRQHRGAWQAVLPAQSDASADIQERLTQLDRDLSDSWFGYHRGGLKGHTSAPPLSRSSVPHSEQSASERLEQQRKQRKSFNHAHTDADEWQQNDFKKTDMKWHMLRHIKCVRQQNTKQHIKVFVSWGWGGFGPLQPFFSPSWGDISSIRKRDTSHLCVLSAVHAEGYNRCLRATPS